MRVHDSTNYNTNIIIPEKKPPRHLKYTRKWIPVGRGGPPFLVRPPNRGFRENARTVHRGAVRAVKSFLEIEYISTPFPLHITVKPRLMSNLLEAVFPSEHSAIREDTSSRAKARSTNIFTASPAYPFLLSDPTMEKAISTSPEDDGGPLKPQSPTTLPDRSMMR